MVQPTRPTDSTSSEGKFASFVDAILFQAAKEPNSPAIGTETGVLTFGQLADAIRSATAQCELTGLRPRSLVGLIIGDPVWHICLIAALYRLGAVSVSLSADEAALASTLDVAALLHNAAPPANYKGSRILVEPTWFTAQPHAPSQAKPFAASDLCRIALSSGTTGQPRPIAMNPQIVWDRLVTYSLRGSFASSERIYCGPQLHSQFGFAIAFSALAYGKMVSFSNSAEGALPVMSYFKTDLAIMSVYQFGRLVELQTKQFGGLGGLREIQAGGSLISDTLLQRARACFPAKLVCTYASTEAGTIATASMEQLRASQIDGAVGFITPWASVDVCDDNAQVMPQGREGNLRVRALGLAPFYQAGMMRVEAPEFFSPGDVGRVLDNNMLVITGRTNELINIGGNKIAPERFENVILQCTGVKDAAVFTVDIGSALPQTWAAVVGDPSVSVAEIVKRCAETPTIGAPSVIKSVAKIPRNSTGKILRDQLRRELTQKG